MAKNRIAVVAILFGLGFLVILGRLWQLQITRYEKYHALATRDTKLEKMVPAMRGPIYDRNGDVLAEDQPFYDISVRIDRVPLQFVKLDEVRDARAKAADNNDRQARFDILQQRLQAEPFVVELARTVRRSEAEVADGLLKALDNVGRNWASPSSPQRILGGIDEKIWIGLRAIHEDSFRDSWRVFGKATERMPDAQVPPFPGLVCTISTRRVYPQGRLACFILGTLGEMGPNEEDSLRRGGILLENAEARTNYWSKLQDEMDDARASELQRMMLIDPREIEDLDQLYSVLAKLRPADRLRAARLGLAEPLRWFDRPPRMQLTEPERLWLGVGFPTSNTRNVLPNRIIGQSGVERVRNDLLRGKSGMKIREDLEGNDETSLSFRSHSEPQEGQAIALTLSIPWQKAVEKALRSQEHPGAIVVLDCRTGDVLAMASFPDFDPNLFSPPREGAERQEKIRALLSDPAQPLLNRAIQEQYPLGSVMKSIVAAAALERGLVNTTETFECPGYIIEGGQKFRCDESRAHGTVNLYKALRCSCNVTFHQIGARVGVEKLGAFAKLIFGRRSGIDLPGEVSGIYPDCAWRTRAFPNNPAARIWTRGNDFQLAIGQGMMTSTVLQAAVLMAAMGNGGYVVTPHVWLDANPVAPVSLGVSPENLAIVREGLDEVVNVGRPGERGTAFSPFHEHGELAIRIAGKTSTAEHRHGDKPHAWFAGYAPADNPQVAFAVMLEEAGHGGAAAAPLAYSFLKDIYGTKNSPVKNPGSPEPVALLTHE